MWYILPQFAGLGESATARHFAIRSGQEAAAYLDHVVLGARYLGARYIECVSALQDLPTSDPVQVFGAIDVLKLRSSLTLFALVRPQPLLDAALERWFDG